MNTIKKVPAQACTGCEACFNVCPFDAITMKENKEGFLYPFINEEKCTNCGQCFKICPVLNMDFKFKNLKKPKTYAAFNNKTCLKSSSGGIFSIIAQYFIENNGYICSVAFNKDWSTEHIIVNKKEDLEKLRGSKYVQSRINHCYKKIENLLNSDSIVLFCGLPCQVAGLYSYLKKDYEKLYTIDLFCHGVPSDYIWQKYLKENFDIKAISNINFRDKEKTGWTCSKCTITFNDNSYITDDGFMKMFHDSIILRESCSDCKFSKLPRPADITLGDFWGVDKYLPDINNKNGISLVLINNKKGEDLLNKTDFSNGKLIEVKLKNNYNNGYIRKGNKLNKNREVFFNIIQKYSYNSACSLINDDKYDVCLLTTFYSKNYGAMLVAYAVNNIIKNLGYSCLMLQKLQTQWKDFPIKNTIPMDFAKKHYNISKSYYDEDELVELNNKCKSFVVGSDQMFSYALNLNFAFLGWVKNYKNKIAFSTSFGHDRFDCAQEEILEKQLLLDRFNHISLREKSDNLCKKIFKIKAEQFIDPTLMIKKEDWEKLAQNVKLDLKKPYLLTYMLDLNNDKIQAIKYIASILNLEIINIQNLDYNKALSKELKFTKNYTPEEFLYLYKNSEFVATDSYHGTCFAIKFNKPFVSIINQRRGGIRYKMFDEMKLDNRFISSFEELKENKDILNKKISFLTANKIIEKRTKEAISWLDFALKNNTSKEKYSSNELYFDSKIKDLTYENYCLKAKQRKSGFLRKIFSFETEKRENSNHRVIKIFNIKFKFKIRRKK